MSRSRLDKGALGHGACLGRCDECGGFCELPSLTSGPHDVVIMAMIVTVLKYGSLEYLMGIYYAPGIVSLNPCVDSLWKYIIQ